ncbi:MAG: hypothetical protein V1750_04085, partial [Acidobacteriota bacterium]
MAVALWILLPLAVVHLALRQWRGGLCFQLLLDLALLALPGRVLLCGAHLGPGLAGAAAWGAPAPVLGSPEQSDLPLQFAVWWEEVRRLAGAGELPWISERAGGGLPLAATGQSQLPFPLHLPVWILGAERGGDVMAIWKLELAALGCFVLGGRLGLRPAAAAIGAFAYAFRLGTLSWLVVPLAWVIAAAPWCLWALAGVLRGQRRSMAILAALLGILAGWSVHPESAVFLWLAVASSGLVLGWGKWRRVRRLLPVAGLALAVAAIGAMPALVTIAGSAKLGAAAAHANYPGPDVDWTLRARVGALLVAPWRDGHPAAGTWRMPFAHAAVALGVGVTPLVLLGAAPLRRRHRRAALACGSFLAAAAILVWQLPGPAHLLGRLPVLGWMVWVRSGFLVDLALAVLAALTADSWLRRPRRRRLLALALSGELALLLLAGSGTAQWDRDLSRTLALAAPVAVAVVAPLGGWPIAGVVLAEEILLGGGLLPGSQASSWRAPPLIAELQQLTGREGGRVLGLGGALPPNLAARWGLSDLRSHDPLRPASLARLHRALGAEGEHLPGPVLRPWAGLAGAWGARFLATGPEGVDGALGAGWEEVFRTPEGRVYRNLRAQPVLRLATTAVLPPGEAVAGEWEQVPFASAAVVEEPLELGGEGTLKLLEQRPWRWRAEVRARGQVLAVLHVPLAAGWQAWRDGARVPIVVANLAAMGVVVADGTHVVEWRYWPPALAPATAVTLVGLAGCLLLAGVR